MFRAGDCQSDLIANLEDCRTGNGRKYLEIAHVSGSAHVDGRLGLYGFSNSVVVGSTSDESRRSDKGVADLKWFTCKVCGRKGLMQV